MKFTCLQNHLEKSLFIVERAAAKTTHLPTLSHVLLEVKEGKLKLATTDLEIGMVSWCAGKAEGDGAISLPAKILSGLLGSLSPEKVTLEVTGDTCVVKSGDLVARVKGLSPEEFPIIPVIGNEAPLTVDAKGFADACAHVVDASGGESMRPELGGVLFQASPNAVTLVATDSFRLSLTKLSNLKTEGIGSRFFQDHTLIIPAKTVRELIRVIDREDPELTVHIGDNQIQFSQKSFQAVSRLIEGTYPRYEDIIPASALGTRTFERRDLMGTLRRAQLFSGRLERVEMEMAEGVCRIRGEDATIGSAVEALATEGEGPAMKFAFNIRYLLEGLALFSGDRIHFEYNEPNTPALIHVGDRDKSLYIVMPMKLE